MMLLPLAVGGCMYLMDWLVAGVVGEFEGKQRLKQKRYTYSKSVHKKCNQSCCSFGCGNVHTYILIILSPRTLRRQWVDYEEWMEGEISFAVSVIVPIPVCLAEAEGG